DPKMINMAEFLVDVRPEAEWPRGVTKDRLIERMNASLQTIPGIEPSFSQPIRDNVLESISQIDGQVVVKIFGDDVDVLRGVAKDALRAISGVRGVARAFVDRAGQVPQLRIAIDRGRAARYGLNVADVEGVVGDMQERVATSLRLPPGYFVTWGGEFENQQRAMARLRLIVPISVLLIFLLLFNAFGAVKHAALILVNVPFALIGGILALYL